ncbi:acyl-CoA desaturase [Hyphococcus sp.]|uniref:acyl-CoA desaturase n=1 Tax=Hyphococcus sp. TaxID=2038636 RepID=UPI003CCC1468
MQIVKGSERIVGLGASDPGAGKVIWAPKKSIWITFMTATGLSLAPSTFSWSALALFLFLTGVTLCAGHSVGMHRRLIHNSFSCPLWLEYVLVYLGVLVGMAGPFGMMRQHDLRDWAQRQKVCHDYLCHRREIFLDYFWQVHCDIELDQPPGFVLEDRLQRDKVYRWMERTWMLQQAPLALALYFMGGWSYVIWGVALRVCVSVTGHWLVGHFAHHEYRETNDAMSWRVENASVQGRDVKIAGFISMGESWHNNHHAFPGSAKIGLFPGQPDPGWWFISLLERMGLAWNIKTPANMAPRKEVVRLPDNGRGWKICQLRKLIWRRTFGRAQ